MVALYSPCVALFLFSHQLYLKARLEEHSKYICADREEDMLKCAGAIAHAKVRANYATLCYSRDIVYWGNRWLTIAVTFPALPATLLHTRIRNKCCIVA